MIASLSLFTLDVVVYHSLFDSFSSPLLLLLSLSRSRSPYYMYLFTLLTLTLYIYTEMGHVEKDRECTYDFL